MTDEFYRFSEAQIKIQFMIEKFEEAYFKAPFGSFWQRWIPGVCKHTLIRCTHGDEILARKGRRRVCMMCGRSLTGSIPGMCFFTGKPHRIDP